MPCGLCLCKCYKQIIRTPKLTIKCKVLRGTMDYVSGHSPNLPVVLAHVEVCLVYNISLHACARCAPFVSACWSWRAPTLSKARQVRRRGGATRTPF